MVHLFLDLLDATSLVIIIVQSSVVAVVTVDPDENYFTVGILVFFALELGRQRCDVHIS